MPDTMMKVRQRYEGLRRDMIRWRDATHLYSRAHKTRWNQALAALGEITGERALTSLEAQAFADRGWKRWDRVVVAIREMEQARGYERQQRQELTTAKPEPTISDSEFGKMMGVKTSAPAKPDPNVRQVNNNAPDYKADYKDACKVINDLRSELSKVKQEKNTARQRLASAEAYGGRQHERAEKLELQLKEAGTISDKEYQRVVEDYEEMRDLCNKQKRELYQLQGRKITFEQAVKAVMDDKIINKKILTEGAKHLTTVDRSILEGHIQDIENAMDDINTWLWDVNSVPPGLIGRDYVGKNYNQDMADMLKLIDHITHQAWQTMLVVKEFGKELEEGGN